MARDFLTNDFKFWRYLINFWSFIFFAAIIYDFFSNNAFAPVLNIISTVYISSLAIYVSNKEFERWYNEHHGQHPGEIFVIMWSILIFILILIDFFSGRSYQLPSSVTSSYIAVLTILAVTRKSKQLYHAKKSKKVYNEKS